MDAPTDLTPTLAALHLYPVKGAAGIAVPQAVLDDTGLDLDRAFMVVDDDGEMLTQREVPALALLSTAFKGSELVLRAPGMLALHLRLDVVEAATRVRVWDDEVPAFEMGDLASQWVTDLLAQHLGRGAPGRRRLRLVRFDPDHRRLASRRWTGAVEAPTLFSDGFPLLVTSTASLADLNRRLAARGAAPVTMARFRPNLVLEGLQPWDEDHLAEVGFDTPQGPVRLRLVKPCVRCSVPNVDPETATPGTEPMSTLAGFRADPQMDGGVTFGLNAIVVEGAGGTLSAGQTGWARWRL
jgi:uncharacterized protein YcbX